MADLNYIDATLETKIVGQDSTGNRANYVGADSNGNMQTKDFADGTPGSAVPSVALQVGGSDGTNLRTVATDTSGRLKLAGSSYFHPVFNARVQSVTAVTSVNATSLTANITATKSGNTIIVAACCLAGTLTISDSASQSYSTATTIAGNTTQTSKIFYFPNTAAGVTTVTISSTSTTALNLVVTEYSGILTASPLDQTSTHGQTGTTSWTSNSTSATTQASELLIGTCMGTTHNNSVFTATAPWNSVATVLNNTGGANLELFIADQNVVATGTYAFTGTVNQSDDLYAAIATFKFVTPNMIVVVNSPTSIKTGAGILRKVVINTVGTGSASVTLYDNTTNSGTIIAVLSLLTAIGYVDYNLNFSTGLTMVVNSTIPDFTVVYD